ncbi:sugar phosphate isomerase/epimerase family protein [Companilactobacillus huachuanensis]|uniref:Sugar phosphate isomerase/epimerase family protein n=1 Tax=Companilactobacillus huachuanensis TaxID=2559914 RepID=A0ABW1RQM4_9LACO|nr:sugar phosphate isomerase/epimerase [Companilactobacillus huachuanensis]
MTIENKIGFLTNCLSVPFEEKIEIASRLRFETMEVACWPTGHPKQCDINADSYDPNTIKNIKNKLFDGNVSISCLAYYDNILDKEINKRRKNIIHLKNVIRLAHKLNVPYVGTYIGKNTMISMNDNFILAKDIFEPILEYAEVLGVNVLIENCPMPSWNTEGYPSTITYSPELIKKLFEILPNKNFGLNFDPSHMYWMGIDYLKFAREFSNRIFSVHVKDVRSDKYRFNRVGLYGKKTNKKHQFDFGYYSTVQPGYGDIDWPKLLKILRLKGFNGPLEVEYAREAGQNELEIKSLNESNKYLHQIVELGM